MSCPNQTWVSDITFIRIGDRKWMYLAIVLDCYSRQVVGWSISGRMKASIVCDALKMVSHNRYYPKGVIVHSVRLGLLIA